MSMLAERKRKQKWSLNPRGEAWSHDTNKFGQKMLEKMGWQQGKGLGANENGMVEHIKISYKNDSKGMGYKETDNQWTEHESNFTALLKSLTGDNHQEPEDVKLNSIEEQSQSSKARVHYHKFTRGKDLTRYSDKDLANIFGKKSLKVSNEISNIKQEDNSEESNSDNSPSFLVNSGSMHEYFKKKLPKLGKRNSYVIGNNGVLKKEETESEDEIKTFGFGYNQNSKSEMEIKDNKPEATFPSYIDNFKKRKLKENHTDNIFSPKKKLKKDKKSHLSGGLTNPAFEPLASHLTFQKNILTPILESNMEENEQIIENQSLEHSSLDNSTVSIKKKSKRKNSCENLSTVQEVNVEQLEYDEQLNVSKNSKKIDKRNKKFKKKCEKTESLQIYNSENLGCEFDNPNFNENADSTGDQIDVATDLNPYEVKPKLKKKKKEKSGIDNINFIENKSEVITVALTELTDNPFEIKRKKKKNKNLEINFNGLTENKYEVKLNKSEMEDKFTVVLDNVYEKIKSKVKKNKKQIRAIDNPSFNLHDLSENSILEEYSTNLENTYEVIKPKKNKKVKKEIKALDNPSFNPNDSSESKDKSEIDITETTFSKSLEGPYEEVKSKKKKKNKKELKAVDNPSFSLNGSTESESQNETMSIVNTSTSISSRDNSIIIEEGDLMLNVVCSPIIKKQTVEESTKKQKESKTNMQRRKSVRFSDVTQELIIPNNDYLRELEENQELEHSFEYVNKGVDNVNFDKLKNNLDENIATFTNTIDRYQAEIENEMNEKKQFTLEDLLIGEVGNPHGENELLSDGTKLKFKYAHFDAKTPLYQQNKVGPKKAYKHLIKGDIIVKFNNSNLHEIKGYAFNKNQTAT